MIRGICLALLALSVVSPALAQDKAKKAPKEPMATPAKTFADFAATEKGCGKDNIVWYNPKTGAFFETDNKFFAKTKLGGYTCRDSAVAAGYHTSKHATRK
ncbi:hypothetical protein ACFSM5_15285 [Lacibacterium aquatile]|uniref:YHS domain-containing protein n=1 Tax=Lacibacterium aquatile TaxID=1168082 RepID=A0ABW5DYG5_9PROT